MAVIATTASLIRQYNAFTGLSAVERSQSGIARAEVVYYNVNDNWLAAGAGNSRLYQTGTLDLPKDFGYVITDAFCRIQGPGDVNAEATSVLRIYPGGVLGPQINLTLTSDAGRQNSAGNSNVGSIAANSYNTMRPVDTSNDGVFIHTLRDKPTALLYPFGSNAYSSTPNPATSWEWIIGEQLEGNSDAYDVSCYFRFLQYDIDQSYNYVVQSPQLTR